jgi:hypothetical protein
MGKPAIMYLVVNAVNGKRYVGITTRINALGGDGRLGGGMSEEARGKLREVHTGNKYRLGKTHTDEVRKKLSEYGHQNISIFQSFQHLGPEAIRKRVRCIETGQEWESIKDAAASTGIARSSIAELCLKRPWRKTAGGLQFEFLEVDNATAR